MGMEWYGDVIDDVTCPHKDRDLGMFGRKIGYLESRVVGQTPCSYEHYLV